MLKDVLTVTCPVSKPAQEFNKFGMDSVQTHIKHGFFPFFSYIGLHLFFHLCYEFFDSGRVDSTILYQSFKGNARDFSSYHVESGKDYSLRGIIDNNIYASCHFQSPDISSLSSDNPSFHFVIRKVYDTYCCFDCVIRSAFLNRKPYDFARFFIGGFFGFVLQSFKHICRFLLYVVFESF